MAAANACRMGPGTLRGGRAEPGAEKATSPAFDQIRTGHRMTPSVSRPLRYHIYLYFHKINAINDFRLEVPFTTDTIFPPSRTTPDRRRPETSGSGHLESDRDPGAWPNSPRSCGRYLSPPVRTERGSRLLALRRGDLPPFASMIAFSRRVARDSSSPAPSRRRRRTPPGSSSRGRSCSARAFSSSSMPRPGPVGRSR